MSAVAFALADVQPGPPPPAAAAPSLAKAAVSVPPTSARVLPAPVHLTIPALGVSSPLLQLGLTSTGALEVPAPGPQYDQAGWYRNSPTPGSVGPAVIAGHVDSARNGPSVFFRLGSLRPHDRVDVTLQDGSVSVFAVDSVARYPKSAFPTKLVYGDTEFPALRLITCGGSFDQGTGHYKDNVVVLAHLVRNTGEPAKVVATSIPS